MITQTTEKNIGYEFIEARQILLSGLIGVGGIAINQRCYLGGNTVLKGRRIVGISVKADAANFTFNGLTIIRRTFLQIFTLTIVNQEGEEQIKDYPVRDLFDLTNTNGNIRMFDVIPNMEASYIVGTSPIGLLPVNPALWLNFYTVKK